MNLTKKQDKIKPSMSIEQWLALGEAFKQFKASRIKMLELCRAVPKHVYADKDWYLDKRMDALCNALEARFSQEYPEMFDNTLPINYFYGSKNNQGNAIKRLEAII